MYGIVKLFAWKEGTPSALLENIFEQEICKEEDTVVSCTVPDAWYKIHGVSYLKHWCLKNGVEYVEEADRVAVRKLHTSVVTVDSPIDANLAKAFKTVTNYVTVGKGAYKIASIYGGVKAFKGFMKTQYGELICRDFKYEIGKVYKEAYAAPCARGFHACKDLEDVQNYYPLLNFVEYHEVELFDVVNDDSNDDKIVGRSIKVLDKIATKTVAKQFTYFVNETPNKEFVSPSSISKISNVPRFRFADGKYRIIFVDEDETMYMGFDGKVIELYNLLSYVNDVIYAVHGARIVCVCHDETVVLKTLIGDGTFYNKPEFVFDTDDETTKRIVKTIDEEGPFFNVEEAVKEAVRAVDNIDEDEDEELPF